MTADYLIPAPFDPRLIVAVAPVVAEAAMATNVASRPIADMRRYKDRLRMLVQRTGSINATVLHTSQE
ncbi:hypothetical protein JIR23_22330 [Bradyrhizobium diazoefficiens]|nr:hypothetical protein [Bradyrhizobium diazoefficiens]QQN62308.1 hypothetical protein JIR23_22330 [Bradyrhizobium diazoefficiens]